METNKCACKGEMKGSVIHTQNECYDWPPQISMETKCCEKCAYIRLDPVNRFPDDVFPSRMELGATYCNDKGCPCHQKKCCEDIECATDHKLAASKEKIEEVRLYGQEPLAIVDIAAKLNEVIRHLNHQKEV